MSNFDEAIIQFLEVICWVFPSLRTKRAIQSSASTLDCFVASILAMTVSVYFLA